MPTPSLPLLNGYRPSWADITVKIKQLAGPLVDMDDIAAINTSTTLEIGTQRGASGGRVMARTTGSKTDEASMTLYRSGYLKFLRGLMIQAPRRGPQAQISLVTFDIVVLHTPPFSTDIFSYVVKGCRFAGRTMNGAEGPDPDQVEVPLSVMEVVDIIDGNEVVAI